MLLNKFLRPIIKSLIARSAMLFPIGKTDFGVAHLLVPVVDAEEKSRAQHLGSGSRVECGGWGSGYLVLSQRNVNLALQIGKNAPLRHGRDTTQYQKCT